MEPLKYKTSSKDIKFLDTVNQRHPTLGTENGSNANGHYILDCAIPIDPPWISKLPSKVAGYIVGT
jgi:hypothetical protein